jgi:hypothetical protein
MTMTAAERLAKLTNRATLYELTISNGERTYLICYSGRKSRSAIWDCVTRKGRVERIIALTGTEQITFARKASNGATMGGWAIRFSGRTEREAIGAGELASVPAIETSAASA